MIYGILYFVVGVLSCFSALVITQVYDWDDENPGIIMYPLGMFVAWPLGIPITMLIFMVKAMAGLSEKTARLIRNRNK